MHAKYQCSIINTSEDMMSQVKLFVTDRRTDGRTDWQTDEWDTPNFISSGSKIVKRLRRRQYDPLIIETTIGLVLGPCTALCRLFLKHCTLTNKAVGTIWRALSKPPQRRQGPDLRPLWLLVGTPSAIRPELAFSRAEHSLPYSDVTIYIFAILYLSSMLYV